MSGMTPERLAAIRERVEAKAWDYLDETEADRGDLLDEVDRLQAAWRMAEPVLTERDVLAAENARLRAGIAELVSVGYSHTPDCEADDWQRVAYGGHPDCGLCWEDKLATLLNPPTEGETDHE